MLKYGLENLRYCFHFLALQAGRQFILGCFTLVLTGAIEATSIAVLQHLLGDLHLPLCTEMDELRSRIRSCSVSFMVGTYW